MDELKRAVRKEAVQNKNNIRKRIDENGLTETMKWYGKKYKGTEDQQLKKFLRWYDRREDAKEEEKLQRIQEVEQADSFYDLTITLEWSKGSMGAMQAKAYTNRGIQSNKTGGWGYDKASTATSEAMNQYAPLMRLVYLKECERLREIEKAGKDDKKTMHDDADKLSKRQFIGYGLGYGILPTFEGGVGIGSHQRICEALGLRWDCITSTEKTDVYRISGTEDNH